jgi:hypothetical protein
MKRNVNAQGRVVGLQEPEMPDVLGTRDMGHVRKVRPFVVVC